MKKFIQIIYVASENCFIALRDDGALFRYFLFGDTLKGWQFITDTPQESITEIANKFSESVIKEKGWFIGPGHAAIKVSYDKFPKDNQDNLKNIMDMLNVPMPVYPVDPNDKS